MDPVKTITMNNRFTAIVEEASATLYRTAHTTFIKLVQDFQCAIATPDGEVFAYPSQSGVNSFIGINVRGGLAGIDVAALVPGDCIITNDPFATDGLVTHMMDVTMLMPIFHGKQLIAFAWSFVHASDIGGAVPGSISPSSTDIFQEGLRIRPVKLYRAGELNTQIKNIFLDNSRVPDEMWGDFQAMLSAMKTAGRRLEQLCDRYGVDEVCEGMQAVLSLAEEGARNVIRAIPDGQYRFGDYLEGLNEGEYTYITVTMTVKGDALTFDFTGTDPQIAAAYNYITGDLTHPYTVQALLYYILTCSPETPRNSGLLRPIKTVAPRGTIVNAEFPASGGSRVAASTRVYDCILGCLNQALPDGLVAAGAGMSGIIVVGSRNLATGKHNVSVINPICGGGGGRRSCDGADAIDARSGYLRSVPAETVELETVIKVRRYALLPDSQSAGKYHGGAAVVLELENTGLEATMTVRGMNRFHFNPWGARGGHSGRLGEVIVNPDRPDGKSIGKINVLRMKRGDVARLITPAGGGFGDPLERNPAAIAADMRRGLLSAAKATADYGVVFAADGAIDEAATAKRRAEMKRATNAAPLVSLGKTRDAYDHIWAPDIRSRLACAVLDEPAPLRPHLIGAVRTRLTKDGAPVDLALLDKVIAEEKGRLLAPSA